MEPLQSPQEQVPTPATRIEQVPAGEFTLPALERGREVTHEQLETPLNAVEINRQVSQAMPAVLPTPVAAPTQSDPVGPDDDTPIVAADEDLIEKEWVDRAKQIIGSTKDDPYRREQEIKRLQLDYVRKRYGKEIGATEV